MFTETLPSSERKNACMETLNYGRHEIHRDIGSGAMM
jgi:hypothetical protein